MPWLRSGDNVATYPPLLAVQASAPGDDRILNEVAGWLWRCSSQSAGHTTDGLIDLGTAYLMGGARTPVLAEAAVRAGLITPQGSGWQVLDDPNVIHIKSRAEVEWDRQVDRDRKSGTSLTGPARQRDGDACRFCGKSVNFHGDRVSARAGTYDHTVPGEAATVDTYLVCCKACNSAMKDGARLDVLDAPERPYYHPKTVEWLGKLGLVPRPGYRSEPARPTDDLTPGGHRRDTARPLPAATEGNAAERGPGTAATPRDPGTAAERDPWAEISVEDLAPRPGPDLAPQIGQQGGIPDGSGRDGEGLAGSGRDGPGRGGSGAGAAQRRRRGRRGGRGRSGGGGR